jgi:hypothetical protein
MSEWLNFQQAVNAAGVSRQRLNEAIRTGRLKAERGGGPGKPTRIQLQDLQAWCASERLAMPVEALERSERLKPEDLTMFVERFHHMVEAMERLERMVEHAIERLERAQLPANTGAAERSTEKGAIMQRLRAMKAKGLSLQAIANQLNAEGAPTLSGNGKWQKGTIGNLLAQVKEH